MADLSDTQIRADLRSVFVAAGVDPDQTSMLCARGIVRVLGELLRLQGNDPVRPEQIGELEQSIRRSRGVKRVYFHLDRFKQLPTGEWAAVDATGSGGDAGAARESVPTPDGTPIRLRTPRSAPET